MTVLVTLAVFTLSFLTLLQRRVDAQKQRFVEEPEDTEVMEGSTAMLKCQVANLVGPVVWTRGGFFLGYNRSIPGHPRYSMIGNDDIGSYHLRIDEAVVEDDNFYQCQVTSTATTPMIKSKRAYLTVNVPPKNAIILGASTVPVPFNQSVNVTCEARGGKPAANITWFKNGVKIASEAIHMVVRKLPVSKLPESKLVDTISQVTIHATKRDSGRPLACIVDHKALREKIKTKVILDVQYPPEIDMSTNVTNFREFQTVRFECEGLANPHKIMWKWYRDGIIIKGQTSHVYIMYRLNKGDHGAKITCEATNTVGSVRIDKILNVEYGPKFRNETTVVAVNEGDTAELYCNADGNPKPGIHWTLKDSNQIITNQKRYVIRNVHREQFGIYVCTAIVLGFPEVSREVYLLKNGPPKINKKKIKEYAYKGDAVRLVCTVESIPQPTSMDWSRRGEKLDIQSSSKYSQTITVLPYGRTSSLKIGNVHDFDFGSYNCNVANSYGSDVLQITLLEKEVFPLAYVVGGAVGGAAVIFVMIIGCVLYHRHKGAELESSTDSESSLERKQKDTNADLSHDYMYPDTLNGQLRQRTKDYNFTKDFNGDFRHIEELNDMQVNNNGYLHGDPVHMYSHHPDILPNHQHTYPSTQLEFVPPYMDTGTIPHSTFRQTPVSNHSNSDTYSRLPVADPATTRFGTNV